MCDRQRKNVTIWCKCHTNNWYAKHVIQLDHTMHFIMRLMIFFNTTHITQRKAQSTDFEKCAAHGTGKTSWQAQVAKPEKRDNLLRYESSSRDHWRPPLSQQPVVREKRGRAPWCNYETGSSPRVGASGPREPRENHRPTLTIRKLPGIPRHARQTSHQTSTSNTTVIKFLNFVVGTQIARSADLQLTRGDGRPQYVWVNNLTLWETLVLHLDN